MGKVFLYPSDGPVELKGVDQQARSTEQNPSESQESEEHTQYGTARGEGCD